jgi:hypothetical protein
MASNVRVGVVGAGPAGITAALAAVERGAEVLLFDTNEIVGRKLLVAGNGRCNLSNLNASAERYTSADPAFVEAALALMGPRDTLARLRAWGVLTYATSDGWCYPLSDSGTTVVETLHTALQLAGVALHLKTKVSDLAPVSAGRAQGWRLTLGGGPHTVTVDRVIVAAGGKAYPALGSKGELFPVLERLGHTIAPIHPALAPLTADVRPFHKLQGVRLDVALRLYEGERLLGQTVGNLMFTDTGFSGPAAMDLSHLVSVRPRAGLRAEIDLLPHHREALEALIAEQRHKAVPVKVALGAALPAKLPPVLLDLAGIPAETSLGNLDDPSLTRLLYITGHLTAQITGTRGFQSAQLSTGGVPVTEVTPGAMASRIQAGLYLAGEVLDVIGPCGGYNLQWAFAGGMLAGLAAGARP